MTLLRGLRDREIRSSCIEFFFFLCRNPSSDWHGCMAAAGGWGQLQVGWGWGYVRGGTARHEALGAHV